MNVENNIYSSNNINDEINGKRYGNPSKELYKVVTLGDCGVGNKTSFLNRNIGNQFNPNCPSTCSISYVRRGIYADNKNILIDFWDTPGQELYTRFNKIFLKDTYCIILGFDITRSETCENVKTFWHKHPKENSETDLIYLVGNKIDLYENRVVDENEVSKYCEENNIRYFEISCKDSSGIQELLDDIAKELIKR